MSISTFDRQNLNRLTPRGFRSNLGDLIAQSQSGSLAYREVSADYTLTADDYLVVATGSGTKTLTLPTAASVGAGKRVEIKMAGSGALTIAVSGSDTIDDIAGSDATSIQWTRKVYTSDGVSAWYT